MPRTAIDPSLRCKTNTTSAYDSEWQALDRLVIKLKLQTRFDVFRLAVLDSKVPAVVKELSNFKSPRSVSVRTLTRRKSTKRKAA